MLHASARRYSEGWLKPCSNVRRRKMIALNDRTRLTVPLTHSDFRLVVIMNENEETLSGVIDSIRHQNTESGFTVLDLMTGDGDVFTVVGSFPSLICGENVTFTGSWSLHKTYGTQFNAVYYERERPKTAADQFTYLASGAIKGVREGIARRIVEEFGENSFDVIEHDPERLAKIKGISRERAIEISDEFRKTFAVREIIISLEKYGLSPSECLKIYESLGERSAEIVERNPYIICELEITSAFDKAEAVAARLDTPPEPAYRRSAGLKYILNHNLSNGHTCVPREKMYAPAYELLEADRESVDASLDDLIARKELYSDYVGGQEYIFLPELYKAEKAVAGRLLVFKRFPPARSFATDEMISGAEVINGICYNQNQRLAIRTAVERGLLILTGGPGTGKTTTLKAILRLFEDSGLEVALAAPTGRAAKRMAELTGREAKTIHRLLEVEFDKHDRQVFQRNTHNPITADAVIVDELSMVDIRLFASLLDALPLGCRLILVGDADQLPPVGAGNVLHDLIASEILPVVELNEVFRQAMESLIVANAHCIVAGELPELSVRDRDFFLMERPNSVMTAETVAELCASRLPKAYGYSPFEDIQVICPSKIGESGCVSLNTRLQAVLNPPAKGKKEQKVGSRIFREGDKVMQIKNNYDIMWENSSDGSEGTGVFNGDIGILRSIEPAAGIMKIDFDDRSCDYPIESASQLDLAYAITVHKSQGCEFKTVIIPVSMVPEKLCYRNLLYTAVTRAKELLIIVGSRREVIRMVNNNVKAKRYSSLISFLLSEDNNGGW